jgi:hypothetical protein
MSIEHLVFLPRPRSATPAAGEFMLRPDTTLTLSGDLRTLLPIGRRLQVAVWETQGLRWELRAGDAEVGPVIRLDPGCELPDQGYALHIDGSRLELTAADPAGAFYGVMTLTQMLRQCERSLPAGTIEDYPDFPTRGVMLDISRDKVPKLETLYGLIDMLAEWKVNHLELYTEHTFAYRNHREVWAQASPMTGEDIARLDQYCRARFIELVPNQNSFGHFHRWLKHPRYRPLAECPEGYEGPHGGWHDVPHTLCPTDPRSLELLEEMYAELLPHFTSDKFNVGCDETWELGRGRSKEECDQKGNGRVYLDFLLKIHDLVKRHGRTMLFWGDIIVRHNVELVRELPDDITVLIWGYRADHPYEEECAKVADSGVPFYVCPGTSTWNGIAGRTDVCLANIRNASENGLEHGALGLLNTDWGDNGHLQYLPVSFLGYAAGAALSWCSAAKRRRDIVAALDMHAFRDRAGIMGRLAYDLGNAYQHVGHAGSEAPHGQVWGTGLFHLLHQPPEQALAPGVTEEKLEATRRYVESVMEVLPRARMDRPDADLIHDEFTNAAHMLVHACRRGIALCTGAIEDEETRNELAADMRIILGEHRRLWVARNRVGGLQDSPRRLEQRVDEYSR